MSLYDVSGIENLEYDKSTRGGELVKKALTTGGAGQNDAYLAEFLLKRFTRCMPAIAISWALGNEGQQLSHKDAEAPLLRMQSVFFERSMHHIGSIYLPEENLVLQCL